MANSTNQTNTGTARRAWRTAAGGVLLLVAAVALSACSSAGAELEGLWAGTLEHNGQQTQFALRFEGAESDSIGVQLSMPAIGVLDLPLGRGGFDGQTLSLGNWSCLYDAEAGTISGTVPASLLPVYEVPFTLQRVDRLDMPETPPSPAPAEPLWTHDTGAPVWAGVAAANGLVFAGNDQGLVTAVRETDGSVAWTHRTDGAVRATPTVAGNGLYVHTDSGTVSRLDVRIGLPQWSTRVGDPIERIPPGQVGSRYDSYASSVLVIGETAYVGTAGGDLVALNAADGTERWRHAAGAAILATPSYGDGRVYLTDFSGRVTALDERTGDPAWSTTTAGPIVSSPALAGAVIVVGNRAYDLLGISTMDGSVRWTYYYWFSWVESAATVRDGVAFVGSSDAQRLNAVEAASGALRWSAPTGGSTWAQPAVTGASVYVGTVGVADYMVAHQGHFLAVDRATGQLRWRFTAERPEGAATWGFASSPVAGARAVYVGGIDGRVYAFPLD